jgi:hypothetical protein
VVANLRCQLATPCLVHYFSTSQTSSEASCNACRRSADFQMILHITDVTDKSDCSATSTAASRPAPVAFSHYPVLLSFRCYLEAVRWEVAVLLLLLRHCRLTQWSHHFPLTVSLCCQFHDAPMVVRLSCGLTPVPVAFPRCWYVRPLPTTCSLCGDLATSGVCAQF